MPLLTSTAVPRILPSFHACLFFPVSPCSSSISDMAAGARREGGTESCGGGGRLGGVEGVGRGGGGCHGLWI